MKTVLHIEGMSCDHCVRHVKDALEEIAGVNAISISLAAKTATVEHEALVSPDVLKQAVEDADYHVARIG
ncbi:MAG: heavy-metal-associated domain-containing protein [Spirochaetaceae bacterium]|jgi:copper ion binding protein|nr:heavy-metal-associated domain-containing protein [Spirochaetaceae bacterium]